jgi:hypothetical protein
MFAFMSVAKLPPSALLLIRTPDRARQHVLGRQLAHVVQQRRGQVRNPLGTGVAAVREARREAKAERMGRAAAWRCSSCRSML